MFIFFCFLFVLDDFFVEDVDFGIDFYDFILFLVLILFKNFFCGIGVGCV